ncbi:Protein arginine N-methyltransferase 1.5, partial [Cucurbita argyrosperma subsp. sororia]
MWQPIKSIGPRAQNPSFFGFDFVVAPLACLLPASKGTSYAIYARRVRALIICRLILGICGTHFVWLCEHHCQLSIVLDILSTLPSPNVRLDDGLRSLSKRPYLALLGLLSKRHMKFITGFFNHHSLQVVLSGKPFPNVSRG